jgi:hypothetical protein
MYRYDRPDPMIAVYASMIVGLIGLVIVWIIARRKRR